MAIQQWTVTEPYLDIKCQLGEGPLYISERNELRFVDIWNEKLYVVDLEKGPSSLREYDTGKPFGVTADIEGSDTEIVAGAKDGYVRFDLTTGKQEYLAKLWDQDDNPDNTRIMRMNDGACDTSGRFWVGSCSDPKVIDFTDHGILFRLDPDGSLHRMWEKITIPNGIQWNAKDDTMYMADGPTERIWQWSIDPNTANIKDRRVFFHQNKYPGHLDGSAFDEEGYLWSALYGAGRVIRISPDGEVVGEILLPTRNITCPTFAGTVLYITTAAEEDPEKHAESARYGGNLFRIDVGVKGMKKNKFRWNKQRYV